VESTNATEQPAGADVEARLSRLEDEVASLRQELESLTARRHQESP
jgi:hypothetical protein